MQMFVRIVEAGSISRAAEQLDIAKSAVSRRLVALEERLGVKLLNRTTRKSSLSEAGSAYFERARLLIEDVVELNAMTANDNAMLKGSLRLAAPLSFGLTHLAPAIDEFASRHPELTLNIDFSDREIDLVEEGFDLAVRIGDLSGASLRARKISPIRIVACASPSYLQKYGAPKTVGELTKHQILRYGNLNTSALKLFDQQGKAHAVTVPSKMIANNGDFLKSMAISGHGIIVSPTFISWKALAAGELVQILTNYTIQPRHAYAVYPQTRHTSKRVRTLIDFLVKRFGDEPYWDQELKLT